MSKISALSNPIRLTLRTIALLSMLVFNVANAAVPTFSAVFSPAVVGPGNESTLIFTVTTDSLQGINDGAFTNPLPLDLIFATPSHVTSDCTNISLSAANGGTVLTASGIDLPASSVCSVLVRVKAVSAITYNNISGEFTSDVGTSGTAAAALNVDAVNMPGYSLSFAPATITQGATSTLTLGFNDSTGLSTIGSWSGTINLSDGLAVAAFPNAVTSCLGTTITANSGSNLFSLIGFGSPANPCSADVDIHASLLGELNASMSGLDWDTISIGRVDIGQASALLTVATAFASFEFDPLVVAPGSTTSLNITLTNRDRVNSLTNIAFSDDLNAALIGLLATGLPISDICGTGSSITGTSFLSFTGGSLAPEASCSFSVPVAVPGTATPGTYTNTSSSFAMDRDSVPITPEDPVSNALQISAAPVLAMNFVDTIAASGSDTTIGYTITNTDTVDPATDITFSHNLGTTFSGATIPGLPADGFCGGAAVATATPNSDPIEPILNILNISGASLAAGANCSFSVDISIASGTDSGDYTTTTDNITATINGTSFGGPGASDTIEIVDGPALILELPAMAVTPGDQVTATFILSKDSVAPSVSGIGFSLNLESALAGLTVEPLPAGEICGTGSAVTLVINGGEEITFTGGTLDVANTCTFDAMLNVPLAAESGSYSLTTSDVTSTVQGVPVTGPPVITNLDVTNLTATMSFIDDPVAPGDSATLRFDFQNTSATAAFADLFFTMDLVGVIPGMVATGVPVNTCTGSTITGTNLLTFTGGNLSSLTSCTFDVTVSVPIGAAANTYNAVTSILIFTENSNVKIISPLTDTLTVEIDEAPSVAITSALSPATSVSPIPVTITFNEDVTGFDVTDITGFVTNGNLSNFTAVTASVYTVDIDPITNGAVTLQVPAASAQDFATIPNDNIVSPIFSIDYDAILFILPTVSIGAPDQTSTSTGPVNFDITYSNADQIDLDAAEVNLVSTGTATATISVTNGTSSTPTVTLSAISGNGTLAISLAADTARNAFGSVAATGNSIAFDVDNPSSGGGGGGSFGLFTLMLLMIMTFVQQVRFNR